MTATVVRELEFAWNIHCKTEGCTNELSIPKRVGRPVDFYAPGTDIVWTDFATVDEAIAAGAGATWCRSCGFDRILGREPEERGAYLRPEEESR